MPAILQPEDWEVWLGEKKSGPADVKAVLRTFDDGGNWTMNEQVPVRQAKPQKSDPQPGLF
jgi:putative SOS response-associated peptidase YedK